MKIKYPIQPNQQYNSWTVIAHIGRKWECQCICGTKRLLYAYNLVQGQTKSCGCSRIIEIIQGQRFGKLTFLSYEGKDAHSRILCKMLCDCGTTKLIAKHSILRPTHPTRSCGCLIYEGATERAIHGQAGNGKQTKEYRTWLGIKARCHSKSCKDYGRYGALAISVFPEWKESFAAFFNYVGLAPTPQHSLDRINPSGNYEPNNVRWATRTEQARNKHNTKIATINGVTKPIVTWAEEYGINRRLVAKRIKAGWDIYQALITPSRRNLGIVS
jgi:hypothetical protein